MIRLIITDGRRDLCAQMLDSWDWYSAQKFETCVVDDSADPDYADWLAMRLPTAHIHSHFERSGLAASIRTAWRIIPPTDYIIHLEDDCIFTHDIDIPTWTHPFTVDPDLAQVCLQRGPDESSEIAAGGILQLYAQTHAVTEHTDNGVTWTTQDKLFSLQPNIYPYWVTRHGWPEHGGETEFTASLPRPHFAYLDGIGSQPRYVHAGYAARSPQWIL